ncbi:hypothetical protein Gotri_022635 [Gossypium trilobum]|uniref:Uncharacterized protein n=1 Tax=Gossypium trilobum TaxID=34281 RepID=A0A7J9DGI5_9ROSI|nr:hypothetical protein [Gossypium trilobum]
MKRFAANPMTTPEYDWWCGKRINDNILVSSQENTRPIEEHLQVILSELEIVKQDFEKKRNEKKERTRLRKTLGSLKTYYKKLHLLMRIVGDLLECQNKKVGLRARVAELERSLHQYRSRNSVIELKASLTEIEELKRKIEELEAALQNCELQI